ncbi:MAG: shikimate dehydrogenase [Anaerolineae bacterium]|nr:shikimate dehydrogenase [Anaerolineae bacterium]
MDHFAFIIHPLDPKADVARKYPRLARLLPVPLIHFLSRLWPPLVLSHVTGIRSQATGAQVEGWLLACPLTTRQLTHLPARVAYRKIIQTGRLAERLNVDILGLGAYTSVVGDGGITVARALNVAVTTGDSYPVALTVQALFKAASLVGVDPAQATVAIVGATGAIGSACAELLAPKVARMLLVGLREERLREVARDVQRRGLDDVEFSTQIEAIRAAHLIISATSAGRPIIFPEHLRLGAVVCDVAQPADVSQRVAEERRDVLVVEGGLVEVPGEPDFRFDFRLPPGLVFGCMAETIALALEGQFEDFTVGKEIDIEKVNRIEAVAARHGFRLAGLRSFGQPVTDEQIRMIRQQVEQAAG